MMLKLFVSHVFNGFDELLSCLAEAKMYQDNQRRNFEQLTSIMYF